MHKIGIFRQPFRLRVHICCQNTQRATFKVTFVVDAQPSVLITPQLLSLNLTSSSRGKFNRSYLKAICPALALCGRIRLVPLPGYSARIFFSSLHFFQPPSCNLPRSFLCNLPPPPAATWAETQEHGEEGWDRNA